MRNFYQTSVLVRVTRTNGPQPQLERKRMYMRVYISMYVPFYTHTHIYIYIRTHMDLSRHTCSCIL